MLWSSSRFLPSGIAAAVLLLLATLSPTGRAASTDISSEPVITRSNVAAKPNLMFILDDSGSMDWSYMPDEMGDSNNDPLYGKYGYWSPQCNGLAYDPTVTYTPPITSTNTAYPTMGYTAARNDGYLTSSSTRDLTGSYYYQYATTGTLQPKLSWTYNSSGAVITSTTFYQECMSDIGNSPGSSKFTRVNMDSATAAQKENYANWFSYYARRFLLMRTAVGKAVQALDSSYRVGFSRINSTSYTDGADFRDAKVFDATQKANFYSSLYGAPPAGGTPLRGALSKIGRYFAKKLPGQTYDPVEYACQRNYALLSTDGYWNSGGSPGPAESSTYGAYDLSGALVGNQDASEVRPMYDGGTSTTTTSTPTVTITITKTDTNTRTTTTSKRNQVVVSSCGFGRRVTATTPQTRTETYTTQASSYNQATQTSTRTVVVTNGVVTSDTTGNSTSNSTPSSPVAPAPVISPTTDSGWVNGTTTTTACATSFASTGTTYNSNTSSTATTNVSSPTTSTVSVDGPTVGSTSSTTSTSGGTSDTLSDVAQYYYATDLRTSALGNCASKDAANVATDVCSNIVPVGGERDLKTSQHMTTFSIGLGVSGTLTYDKNYLNQTSGDYVALTNGTKTWPATTTSISGGSGDARNIDDLWHAAVNGRGQYYSALNATELSAAITGVVSTIKAITGSGAAASFDTLSLVAGDVNRVYQASYTTAVWSGDLKVFTVNGETGAIGGTALWSAQDELANKVWSTRNIYYRQAPGTSTLRAFNYTNLNADGYVTSNFSGFCNKTPVPTQCGGLDTTKKALADDATNLINYLRGDATYESGTNTLYRSRTIPEGRRPLGDIINGAPVYVGKPPFGYTDAGYATFSSTNASRTPVVYVGANDGMLHAFSAATGAELWAYVPTAVMNNMYKLANAGYATSHQYFVDAEPVIGDIFVGGAWKTILVGGLGAGGKSYYALDITDPAAPTTLWEFTDANLGLSYGNPIITKRADGTWVVAFSSGYNNTTGDGKGRLYVVNANTGVKLLDLPTTAGSSSSPSGLAKINAWIDKASNNTTKRFYGGDLFGNLWRFDIDNLVAPNQAAHLMAQLQTSGGVGQPITTRPEPVLISGTFPAVAVATGRYLGTSDVTDNTQQGLYLLKDSLTATGLGVVRSNTSVVKHTVSVTGSSATTTTEGVTWDTQNGWWFDLPQTGERVVTNMGLVGNTLTVASTLPNSNACSSGGASWLYRIDITNGLPRDGGVLGQLFSNEVVIVGLTSATLTNGDSRLFVKDSGGGTSNRPGETAAPPGSGDPRRSSWRELID